MSVRRFPSDPAVRRKESMLAAASHDYSSAFGAPAVPLAPFVYKESITAQAGQTMATQQQQQPPRTIPARQRQPRASTAAQLGKGGLDEPTTLPTQTKQRPASGPLGLGARPRNLPSSPVSSMQSAQQAWAQVAPPAAAHSYLSADMKKPPPSQMRTGPPPSQMQRAPLSNHVSTRTKPRASALASPLTAALKQHKGRPRPSPATRAANATEKVADTLTVSDHILAAAAPLYSNLSPAHGSMHAASAAAAAASSLPVSRPARPGVFDPLLCMYSGSPDYVVSLPVRRAVVGKLSCKQPALMHCLRDRLAYMFFPNAQGANAHSANPQESLQIMLELAWNDVAEVRCSLPAANATAAASAPAGSFSFKIHHDLPAFDSFGDYEPHLRNHRITFDFHSQQELIKFRQNVLPLVLAQAQRR